jgi:ferredoxin
MNDDPVRTVAAMRVVIDGDKCQGHNRCYAIAPELFDVDEYGQSLVRGDGVVPPELVDKARLAVANCPEYAIGIVEDDA